MLRTTRTKKVTGVSTVFTRCPDCGKLLRVAVDYQKNGRFKKADYTCGFCGCEMTVEDCHKVEKEKKSKKEIA